jgi:hypothetical protein
MHDVRQEQERAANNQAIFRSVNERAEGLPPEERAFTCECWRIGCARPIEMGLDEYEAIRTHPSRFAVCPSPNHVNDQVERVVERHERYWVVEKFGRGDERARELDPRRRAGS